MKTSLQVALALSVALCAGMVARAAEYLVTSGTLTLASSGSTAVSPKLLTNHQYAVACTAAATYKVCVTSTCTATADDAPVPSDGHLLDVPLTSDLSGNAVYYIGFYANGAAATCHIYDVKPQTLPGF